MFYHYLPKWNLCMLWNPISPCFRQIPSHQISFLREWCVSARLSKLPITQKWQKQYFPDSKAFWGNTEVCFLFPLSSSNSPGVIRCWEKKSVGTWRKNFGTHGFSLLPPQKQYKTLCLKLTEIKPRAPGEDNDSITTGNIFFSALTRSQQIIAVTIYRCYYIFFSCISSCHINWMLLQMLKRQSLGMYSLRGNILLISRNVPHGIFCLRKQQPALHY